MKYAKQLNIIGDQLPGHDGTQWFPVNPSPLLFSPRQLQWFNRGPMPVPAGAAHGLISARRTGSTRRRSASSTTCRDFRPGRRRRPRYIRAPPPLSPLTPPSGVIIRDCLWASNAPRYLGYHDVIELQEGAFEPSTLDCYLAAGLHQAEEGFPAR